MILYESAAMRSTTPYLYNLTIFKEGKTKSINCNGLSKRMNAKRK